MGHKAHFSFYLHNPKEIAPKEVSIEVMAYSFGQMWRFSDD